MPNQGFIGARAPNSGDPWGLGPRTTVGTASTPTLGTGSQVDGMGRFRLSASTTAGRRSSGACRFWRGDSGGRGGFRFEARFALGSNNAGTRLFVGVCALDAFLVAAGEPSAQTATALVGVAFDSTSGTGDVLRLMHCDGAGNLTNTALTGLTRSTTQFTNVRISAAPSTSSILVEISRRNSDGTLTETTSTLTTNIPPNTSLLYAQISVEGNGGANSGQIDFAEAEFRSMTSEVGVIFDPDVVHHGWFGLGSDAGAQGQHGAGSPSGNGTSSVGTIGTTNYLTTLPRTVRTTANTTSSAGWRQLNQGRVWRGNAAGMGGFDVTLQWGHENHLAGVRAFTGLYGSNSTFLTDDGEPSTRAAQSMIGFGFDSTEAVGANWRLVVNDGAAGVDYIDTSIPRAVASVLRLRLECTPNESAIRVTFEDLTSSLSYTSTVSSNLPSNTALLAPQLCARGATGQTVALIGCWYRRVI